MTIVNASLEDAIRLHLRWDTRVDASNIIVNVSERHVTLSGSVPSYLEKSIAFDDVRKLPRVRSVLNQITVQSPSKSNEIIDSSIRANIRQALSFHPKVDSANIDIKVTNGRVELDGVVASYWHKAVVEGYAINAKGVVHITNRLVVAPLENAADDETARDIMRAFRRSQMIKASSIHVKVEDGHVTLTGNVPGAEVHQAAEVAASYTFGVTSVDNLLAID